MSITSDYETAMDAGNATGKAAGEIIAEKLEELLTPTPRTYEYKIIFAEDEDYLNEDLAPLGWRVHSVIQGYAAVSESYDKEYQPRLLLEREKR